MHLQPSIDFMLCLEFHSSDSSELSWEASAAAATGLLGRLPGVQIRRIRFHLVPESQSPKQSFPCAVSSLCTSLQAGILSLRCSPRERSTGTCQAQSSS